MSEIRFYEVKVGTMTRAGNLNTLRSFVAQSDKTAGDVHVYYARRYEGFSVNVSPITEVVKDEIPATSVPYGLTPKEKRIEELERKISKYQNLEFDRFTGTVSSRIAEVKDLFTELIAISERYKEKKNEIIKVLESYLKRRYGAEVDISYATIGEFNQGTGDIPFTIRLNGKITSTDNKL